MYNNYILNSKIEKEYERMRSEREKEKKEHLNDIYAKFPRVKQIDDKISTLAVTYATKMLTEGISADDAVCLVETQRNALQTERRKILDDAGFVETDIPAQCELCGDTGIVDGKKCSCYLNIMKKVLAASASSNENAFFKLENDTFDKFDLSWYDKNKNIKNGFSEYDNMRSVYVSCKLFCNNFANENKNLYFCGTSGTGKTFLATCIANELISKGYSVVYQSSHRLFQFLEDFKFCRIDRESNQEYYNSIYDADLLIIDDLGTEFISAYTCSVFFDILNTRLMNKKSTVISSNLFVTNLEKKYTDRISSRIAGYFDVMAFTGPDIRIAKNNK